MKAITLAIADLVGCVNEAKDNFCRSINPLGDFGFYFRNR